MAFHSWSVPCHEAIIDFRTHVPSYINANDAYQVNELPFVFPPLTVGSEWWREMEGERFFVRLRLLGPGEKEVAERSTEELNFETHRRYRVNLSIVNITVTEAGDYYLVVEQSADRDQWKEATRIRISIEYNPPVEGDKESKSVKSISTARKPRAKRKKEVEE